MAKTLIPCENPLRVCHIPQVGHANMFTAEVQNEREAYLLVQTLANQHLWLHKNGFIPDYANIIKVEMATKQLMGFTLWESYYNEAMDMEWEEVSETFFEEQ